MRSATLGVRYSTALLAFGGLAGVVACTSDSGRPTGAARGALTVTITGLPASADAVVAVTGPGNFSRALTATTSLAGLAPGTYLIAASGVVASGTLYTPAPASQEVDVLNDATASASIAYAAEQFSLVVQQVVQGLANPVFLTAPPGDPRLFIVEQAGRVRVVKDGALLPTPFLDISARVVSGGERGLLSLAFDPSYATNGRFYVYYTGAQGDIFVDRHVVSANPDIASTAFEPVIAVEHRSASNHNGGLVMFGPDGMLYLAPGDGGGGGDPQNNGQNINSLLGKMLRLDVSSLPYTIPPDNPFVNQPGADEIWALGLRNPWRFAFDGSGAAAMLYIADVGQNAWEEINAVPASAPGVNYGWRTMEGRHCFNPPNGCNTAGLTLPVHEYGHDEGCSITGGFVYRGAAIPELAGHYFYSDFCGGWLRSLRVSGATATDHVAWNIGNVGNVLSFGKDGSGELYLLSSNGRVYRIVRAAAAAR